MVENGARHLVSLSRSGARLPSDQDFLEELRSQGYRPVTIKGSVANMDDVERAVTASSLPIAGVIHLGMVLKPAPILDTSYDDWKAVQDPKVKGAWNLHCALGSTVLDFFVVLSSITGVCGSIGQVSYSSANAYLDALVRYRRSLGLPAATLDLGAVSDIGCFTREPEWLATVRQWELQLLDEKQAIEALQATICVSQVPCGNDGVSASGQVIVGMSTTRKHTDPSSLIPWHDARYRLYANIGPTKRDATEDRIVDQLKRYLTQAQQKPATMLKEQQAYDLLLEYIGRRINFNARNLAEKAQIARMSIDSIVTIETAGYLRRTLGIEMSIASLSVATTIEELSRVILTEIYQRTISPRENESV
ncbi:type I iterative polyketide synthase [Penicillium longicatenatum]|nr:type I iterative polyketide synthase [Penicillium longicatenatum]